MLEDRDESELLELLIDERESKLLLRLEELSDDEDRLENELERELILDELLLLLALCASAAAAGRINERADNGMRYLRISPL